MQSAVFTGRLSDDPVVSDNGAKAIFRLLEKRGKEADGRPRLVGINCISWKKGLNEKVILAGLRKGCEALVAGAYADTEYTTQDGVTRKAKELVVSRLSVLDWADAAEEPIAGTARAGD
ncbi:MAG: single-strand DNA-binding protein [Brevundimonas sp.]|jgi:single-strand DNA-binding protein|uniref:single-stranded DNA-binding protein n=1 Tax=Brevundimonas sp. TaxID=1871086 RepID=UPI0039E33DF4